MKNKDLGWWIRAAIFLVFVLAADMRARQEPEEEGPRTFEQVQEEYCLEYERSQLYCKEPLLYEPGDVHIPEQECERARQVFAELDVDCSGYDWQK